MSAGTIAVVGASRARHKFGNKCVRAYHSAGWEVFPVNPHESEIENLKTYSSLGRVGARLDRISIYLQPSETERLVEELRAHPGSEIWFNPDSAAPATIQRAGRMGLEVRDGCSIVDIGVSPSQFP